MKRFHVHVAVDNLKQSIDFYSALFAAEPSVAKPDYAQRVFLQAATVL
jgi:catechol 2,3-dioxygenase-like lactoylglutathione lyase family enzyme